MVAGSGRVIHRRTLNGRRFRGVHTSTAMSRSLNLPTKYRSPSTWSRKNGGEHDMGFERRLASSNPHCGQSRSQSRSPTPREMVHAAGPIRRSVGLSRLALVPPYVRSVDSTNRRMLSASRNINELLQSASSPEPLQVEYFDQPQQDSRTRIDDLSDCDVVEVGRHILGQSYATVEDIRSFVNELPIEGAHIDMASLLDAIQNMDTLNAADLVFPLVGMAALVNTVISANEELKEEVAKLRNTVSSLTRTQLRGVPTTREFHYTPTHITGKRVLSSSRAERRLVYNPMRIANKRFSVPSVRGIPAREDLGVYVTELSGDGEFIKDKSVITYIQKISRYIVSRMIPPELYSSFSVRTRERGLKGVTYIDFPQVYLKAIADLHIACCGVQPGDDENEHYIVTASDFAVKTALNDLRRKPPKISAKARIRNEQEYGQVFEGDQATEAISGETFDRHDAHSPAPLVIRR